MQNKRILIAEDNLIEQLYIRAIFEESDFEIDIAEEGLSAIEMIGKTQYDLLITDIEMPFIGGVDVIHYIKHVLKKVKDINIPIVVLTKYNQIELADRFEVFGLRISEVDGVLSKPAKKKEMFECIDKIFG